MSFFVEILLSKAIGCLVLVLLILALRPYVLKYLNADFSYKQWLVIPLFLLIPFNLIDVFTSSHSLIIFPHSGVNLNQVLPINNVEQWFSLSFFTVWLVVLCALVLDYASRYLRLLNSLEPLSLNFNIDYLSEKQKQILNKTVICHSSLIKTPAVFGIFKAYLILPVDFKLMPQSQQKMILLHELLHIQRNDYRINFVKNIIKIIFWFNPVFLIADKYFEADQELACDLDVMRKHQDISIKQYGLTLIENVQASMSSNIVNQWNYQSLITERITMLNKKQQKSWHSWFFGIFAAVSIWGAATVTIAASAEEAKPIKVVQPNYPKEAAKGGVEGWVQFEFDLDANGTPVNLKVADSSPKGVFEDVSRAAISQWKFKTNGGHQNKKYTLEFKVN
ncbi:TonB family protein [Aliikangiella sp. IMCC44632]